MLNSATTLIIITIITITIIITIIIIIIIIFRGALPCACRTAGSLCSSNHRPTQKPGSARADLAAAKPVSSGNSLL